MRTACGDTHFTAPWEHPYCRYLDTGPQPWKKLEAPSRVAWQNISTYKTCTVPLQIIREPVWRESGHTARSSGRCGLRIYGWVSLLKPPRRDEKVTSVSVTLSQFMNDEGKGEIRLQPRMDYPLRSGGLFITMTNR